MLSTACLLFVLAGTATADAVAASGDGKPPPPAITFDVALDDYAVLQQTPSVAFVFGTTTSAAVTVAVSGAGCPSLTGVKATIFNSTWKAKVPGPKGGDCTIVATDGHGNAANLTHVTYGDVWYCGGQVCPAAPRGGALSVHTLHCHRLVTQYCEYCQQLNHALDCTVSRTWLCQWHTPFRATPARLPCWRASTATSG